MPTTTFSDEETVALFREFLKIRSTSHLGPSTGTYAACVDLLGAEARKRGYETRVVFPAPERPLLICTLVGKDPSLPSLLLNSHYDVVPVEEGMWTMGHPWEASMTSDGFIVGRGAQDMKCVCIQHLEGLARAAKASGGLLRTVHLTFVPDEEIGGLNGLGAFVAQGGLKELNVGCALDEGLANPKEDTYTVFYGERAVWWLRIKGDGAVGHGSRFVKNQAVIRVINAVNKFMAYRAEQEAKYEGHGCKHGVAHKLGDVVTVNCTMLSSGVTSDNGKTYALNVIPMHAEAGFDIRIPPSVDLKEFEQMVRGWTDPEGLEIEFVEKVAGHYVSGVDRERDPWWNSFVSLFEKEKINIEPEVFPAGTDSRYIREAGIPAYGFSPMAGTPILLHDHNERIHKDVFVKGIHTMASLIKDMANLPKHDKDN